jgi:hypothetical protein
MDHQFECDGGSMRTSARMLPWKILNAQCGRHVRVAKVIVNNNPETMKRSRPSFRTAAGWCFARTQHRYASSLSNRPRHAFVGVVMGNRSSRGASPSYRAAWVGAPVARPSEPRRPDSAPFFVRQPFVARFVPTDACDEVCATAAMPTQIISRVVHSSFASRAGGWLRLSRPAQSLMTPA